MKIKLYLKSKLLLAIFTFAVGGTFLTDVSAQKRDNLTDKEDLIIREAQELDLRMKVLSKVIDRRLQALGETEVIDPKKKKEKDESDWGELRTGTFGELFSDIQKTLDEAIMKIDDAASRDINNPLFGKAVHVLADGCQKWTPKFRVFLDKAGTEKEKGLVFGSIEYCTQIIDASSKVSREVKKEEKKKKN